MHHLDDRSGFTCNNTRIMDDYTATGIAEGWIPTDDEDRVVEAWQYLHDTGIAYGLQGWFGRTARELIEQGVINE